MPKSAQLMAMPPPIVPAPTTAMVSTFLTGTSLPMSGTRIASRSAKKA